MGVESERALFDERIAEGVGAVQLQRQPDAQAAKVARQLGRHVGEAVADLLVGAGRRQVLQVVGAAAMRGPQRRDVTHQQCTGAIGQEQALVRVDGDGIGELDAGQQGRIGQAEEAAVSRVGVEPQRLRAAHRGQFGKRVHGAGVGGAGAADDQEWREAAAAVGGDHRGERIDAHPQPRVHRHGAQVVGIDADDARRLGHRMVRLGGVVKNAARELAAQLLVTRGQHGGEVRERAARGEYAAGRSGVAHHRAQPRDRGALHLRQDRRRGIDTDITVTCGRHEVGERRRIDAAARNVGEVARAGGVERFGEGRRETREQRLERNTAARQRFAKRGGERCRVFDVV